MPLNCCPWWQTAAAVVFRIWFLAAVRVCIPFKFVGTKIKGVTASRTFRCEALQGMFLKFIKYAIRHLVHSLHARDIACNIVALVNGYSQLQVPGRGRQVYSVAHCRCAESSWFIDLFYLIVFPATVAASHYFHTIFQRHSRF